MKLVETPQAAFERHLNEVKLVMKPKGKNELIKIIGALLVDNHGMKVALAARKPHNKFLKALTNLLKRIFKRA